MMGVVAEGRFREVEQEATERTERERVNEL